ncbi:uncharacterized protein LOC143224012 [Tachypleus tridentatus]|uniref:uncharacterized protein LOC143224012 n=1 Tax=Tachypleus tridentatus TaxID=6853 RepID=UPI003FD6247D
MGNPTELEQTSHAEQYQTSPGSETTLCGFLPPPYSNSQDNLHESSSSSTNETLVPSISSNNLNSMTLSPSCSQTENTDMNDAAEQQNRHESVSVSVGVNEEVITSRILWPHSTSCTFACISSIVGIYSINRFLCWFICIKTVTDKLEVHFALVHDAMMLYLQELAAPSSLHLLEIVGHFLYEITFSWLKLPPCFIVEFLILSMVLGVPFLCLQMTLGQYIGSGLVDMWYISPAFKGKFKHPDGI